MKLILNLNLKEHNETLVMLVMTAVIIFFGIYRIEDIWQPIVYPDEYGYWANSSFFMGHDWSSTISSTYYYSYGYSLLMIPIRLLTEFFIWDWRWMYQGMVVVQSFMLAGAFIIATKLCKRYMPELNWIVRDLACLVVFLYPTYIVYAHMTWTEVTLVLMFWIFLYTLMRLTDKPTWLNHIGFASVSFYMYMIHQRCLGVVIASIMIVIWMRLQKQNKLSDVAYFFGVMFVLNCIHNVIKGKLQNDFYMANEPAGIEEMLKYLFGKETFILAGAIIFLMICLWLIAQGKGRVVLVLALISITAGIVFVIRNFRVFETAAGAVENRMAVNDFAGQLWKIKDIFTLPGFLRLLISIAGKWFYLASASGLLICYGIWSLGKHFIKVTIRSITHIWKKDFSSDGNNLELQKADMWYWGMFLTWMGVFGLSALAMMGINRVDMLIYGRYHEFAAGILLICGFYSLIKDDNWVRHLIIFLVIYILAGWLCQHLFDELGNSRFASCNCIMLGQVIRGGQVPNGKIWQIIIRSVSFCIFFCLVTKVGQRRFQKIEIPRLTVALMVAACLFAYMGVSKTEDLVIGRNEGKASGLPAVAVWINRFYHGEPIYFLRDTDSSFSGMALQFMLYDKIVTLRRSASIQHGEDAFYVAGASYAQKEEVLAQCGVIADTGNFVLLAPLEGKIYREMEEYLNMY